MRFFSGKTLIVFRGADVLSMFRQREYATAGEKKIKLFKNVGGCLLRHSIAPAKLMAGVSDMLLQQRGYTVAPILSYSTAVYLTHEPVEVIVVGSDVVVRQLVVEHLPNRQDLISSTKPQHDQRRRQSDREDAAVAAHGDQSRDTNNTRQAEIR